jgi:hypothetical protein
MMSCAPWMGSHRRAPISAARSASICPYGRTSATHARSASRHSDAPSRRRTAWWRWCDGELLGARRPWRDGGDACDGTSRALHLVAVAYLDFNLGYNALKIYIRSGKSNSVIIIKLTT